MKKKERGLILSHEMNLAYRAGKKNVTRRLSGLHPVNEEPDDWSFVKFLPEPNRLELAVAVFQHQGTGELKICHCPYGHVGTPLWIKEAHTSELAFPGAREDSPNYGKRTPIYKADKQPHVAKLMKWREPYKMPRAYARSFAELAALGVERIQDITNVGAIDEGVLTLDDGWIANKFPDYVRRHGTWVAAGNVGSPPVGPSPRERFRALIEGLHKEGIWAQNLWTWVIHLTPLNDYQP